MAANRHRINPLRRRLDLECLEPRLTLSTLCGADSVAESLQKVFEHVRPYATTAADGPEDGSRTSLVYTATTGRIDVVVSNDVKLTSLNIVSDSGIFTGDPADNLGGRFDIDTDTTIFKTTFDASFGSLSFGNVARPYLESPFLTGDLTVTATTLVDPLQPEEIDLTYVPPQLVPDGREGDDQMSLVYDPATGSVGIDTPTGIELTSIALESATGIFTGYPAKNLGGDFDTHTEQLVFKAMFGDSFGSLDFGRIAQPGLAEQFLLDDITVLGSTAGGGGLGMIDLAFQQQRLLLFHFPDVFTYEDTPTAPIALAIDNRDTPSDGFAVTVTSGNPSLVPDSNIVLTGSGLDRTAVITPAADQFGSATMTVFLVGGNRSVTAGSFQLTVQPVNDAPVVTSPAAVSVPADNASVLTVTAGDPDGDAPTFWLAGGDDLAAFRIDRSTGALRFSSPRSFSKPSDLDGDNVYEVQIAVHDGNGATGMQSIHVTLTAPRIIGRLLGDSNNDGVFDRLDIVQVMQSGKYATQSPATLEQGDWNGDGVFDQLDLIAALEAAPAANAVIIDRQWLAEHGPAPYVLTQPDTTYVLQEDITASGTAIVVGAPNVTLDLNGHTVTYDNGSPVALANGGFEEGQGRDVPGWDISGAPSASIAPNDVNLFGDQVLRLSSFSAPQTIISDPISIPVAHHTYAATVTPAHGQWETRLTLTVLDAVTGDVLVSVTRQGVERGRSPIAHFFPNSTNPVRLQITLEPADGVTTTVNLDYAAVMTSYDYGILASSTWFGSLDGYENLTAPAQASYQDAKAFKVRNGRIVQGKSGSYAGSAFQFKSLRGGFDVANMETFVWGMDTHTLAAHWAGGGIVRDSSFESGIQYIGDRMRLHATLDFDTVYGDVLVQNNVIRGPGQIGILASRMDGYDIQIRGNSIFHESYVTNGYGIFIVGVESFVIANNTVVTENGRGIIIDGRRDVPTTKGEVFGNYIEIQEKPNREYGSRLEATALRMRKWASSGPHRNVRVHDNTFIAKTGPGLTDGAYAGRITYTDTGSMEDSGIVLERNLFKAITEDQIRSAKAFVLDGVSPKIDIEIRNNVFESNLVSLQIADNENEDNFDTVFVSNVIRRSNDGITSAAYKGIAVGFHRVGVSNIQLFDNRFENGASSEIFWEGAGTKNIAVGSLLDVRVHDDECRTLANARIRVRNKVGQVVYEGLTDGNGDNRGIRIVHTFLSHQVAESAAIEREPQGPFRLEVVAPGYELFDDVIDLTASNSVTLNLHRAAPP